MTVPHTLLSAVVAAASLSAQSPERVTVAADLARGTDGPYVVTGTVATPALQRAAADASTYTARLGDGAELTLHVAGADAEATLDADLDGDGESDHSATAEPKSVRSRRGPITQWTFTPELERGVTRATAVLTLPAGDDARPTLQLRPTGTGYAHGTAEIAGGEVVVLVADLDADGRLGTSGDGWVVHPSADMARLSGAERPRRFNAYSMIETDEPCFVDGQVVRLEGVEGTAIELRVPADDDDDLQSYLQRRNRRVGAEWRERFAGPLAPMITQRREADREETDVEIAWLHTLDLEDALQRAQDENKPILADFETDWCIWCKVLDHLTYPDAAVAEYVRANFVPVKLNAELLVEPLTERYEVTGYPSMVVIAPDGTRLDTITGYEPPSEFLESLTAARAAFDEHVGD